MRIDKGQHVEIGRTRRGRVVLVAGKQATSALRLKLKPARLEDPVKFRVRAQRQLDG